MDRSKLLEEFGFTNEEEREIQGQMYAKTGFPMPYKSYILGWEVPDMSLEEPYFWILDTLKNGFPIIEKLEDSFAAAENSAYFGLTQTRLGAAQDRITNLLITVAKLIKELFQIVREMRILDERLDYYVKAQRELIKPIQERNKNNDITLKGIFVDLVQGGAKSAASVFGMAQQLEFITLPDLFFDAPPFATDQELDVHINNLAKDFNENVLRVLRRHLNQYTTWRGRTHKEHANRKQFMLQYLLQHYQVIQMYIAWVKPYLRNAGKLAHKAKNMDSADIVAAFEGSMLDVEFLARKKGNTIHYSDGSKEDVFECVLITFEYRTRAELKVHQDQYQRGPVHVGKFVMNTRCYMWPESDIENYKKLKEKETLHLLGDISESVGKAMESLGSELERYLAQAKKEAGVVDKPGDKKKEVRIEAKKEKEPFLKKFLGEFYITSKNKKTGVIDTEKMAKREAARKMKPNAACFWGFTINHTFKKAHKMIAW